LIGFRNSVLIKYQKEESSGRMLKALKGEEPAAVSAPVATDVARVSPGLAYWATVVLALVGLLSAVDRNILALLLVPIKKDLGVSDSAMGALTGGAFAVVYATAALPMARLADRGSRRNIIAAAVVFWSAMTAACGLATSYVWLLLARIGVAAGESSAGPATSSMLGDLFPADKRGGPISILTIGAALGFALGAYIAGVLNDRYGWHIAMMAVAAPGLLVALLMWLTVPEPPRGAHDGERANQVEAGAMGDSLRTIAKIRTVAPLLLGMIFLNVAFLGWLNWLPAFLMRVHHLKTAQMSAIFGAVVGIGGVLGNVVAGFASDRVARRGARWRMYYCGAMIVLAVPLLAAVLIVSELKVAIACMVVFSLTAGGLTTVTGAAALAISPPRLRAFMAAVFGLAVSILGAGGGPWLIGALNDALKGRYGDGAIRYSMALIPLSLALSGLMFLWASRTIDRDSTAPGATRQGA
jgi:predicted MFS family arabinose efflux permease